MESNLVQNLVNLKSLPETWAVKDFKEVVSDNSGGNKKLAKSNFLNEGEIAVVDQGKKLIAGYYNDTSLAVKTQPPYVIFGDHTRAFKYVDFPFIMGADGTKVLQPKKGNCTTKYLYYFFLSINVPNTGYNRHFKYLKNLKIPLPPLDQQKKIAAILNAADAYRQKTKALIEKYDELTQSLFLDMFGDPVTNPKGWGELEFKDIVIKEKNAIVDGPFGSSIKQIDYVDEGIPIIRINNVRNEGYYDAEYKYLRREKYLELIRSKVQQNDILIARVGNTIGKACVFNKSFEALLSTTGVAKASIDFTRYNLFFIIKMISLPIYKQYIMSFVQGAGQPYLNLSKIKSFKVIDVPFDLQNQFAERVQAIESQKAQAQASLAQAEDLFNSLLQRAFKGELV